ncbi:MAG: hypothetical protein HYW70_01890 [Candidatus Nealsonbacteria bacterium]|nr:hypothetical protein [Candidatus Nealsonbacteria bacterium]
MANPFIPSHEAVWKNATLVSLNKNRLSFFAKEILGINAKEEDWHYQLYPGDDDPDLFIDFLGLDMAICFATTDFDTKQRFAVNYKNKDGRPWAGTLANTACIARALDEGIDMLNPKFLQEITLKDMLHIFRTDLYPLPMLKERMQIFREVGFVLEKKYQGSFHNLFRETSWRAFNKGKGIVERLMADFPSFYDASPYRLPSGEWSTVYFLKRAQLFPMIYHGRAMSVADWQKIEDIDEVGPICDYVFPGVFEHYGILEYAPILQDKIKKGELIPRHSIAEIEMRSFGMLCQLKLCEMTGLKFFQIDPKIWYWGRDKPALRFLCPTTDY